MVSEEGNGWTLVSFGGGGGSIYLKNYGTPQTE